MQISKLIPAALAALTITGFAATANAAPAADAGDYVTRTVRSNNGKDPFVRVVKVPKAQALAKAPDCPMMKGDAAMRAMCDDMMGDRRSTAAAPKG
jgi:hypothetical protein